MVASVHIGLIFSAKSFIRELKAILDIDPETLKLKKPFFNIFRDRFLERIPLLRDSKLGYVTV